MIYPGSTQTIEATFTIARTGLKADPDTITLELQDPSGSETTYTYAAAQIERLATGVYSYDLTIPDSAESEGTWYYKWTSTGQAAGVMEGRFRVADSQFAD